MKLDIVLYPDPILTKTCAPVPEVTEEIRRLAADMLETMYAAPGVGLAAPQVGRLIQLVVYDPAEKDAPRAPQVLINPVVTKTGKDIVSNQEGCLSVPMDYRANVVRSSSVHLKYMNLLGETLERDIEGFEAIIVQHETDHLTGTLFIDKIGRLRRSLYDTKVKKWLKTRKEQ